jgi:GNAT superfamily N-acetyltransferase
VTIIQFKPLESSMIIDPTSLELSGGMNNFARHYLRSHRFEGGDEHDCCWLSSTIGFPVYSCVLESKFDAETADERIDGFIVKFLSKGSPWCWFVTPVSQPSDLGARLQSRRLQKVVELTAMAARFEDLVPTPELPAGVVVRPVQSEEEARAYGSLYPLLFDAEDDSFIPDVAEVEAELQSLPGSHSTRYLAFKDGKPVSAGSTSYWQGVASLDTLCTLPELRNQGIGAALCLQALRIEQTKGADRAIVWAGPAADKLYSRLGFREVFPVGIYMPV